MKEVGKGKIVNQCVSEQGITWIIAMDGFVDQLAHEAVSED